MYNAIRIYESIEIIKYNKSIARNTRTLYATWYAQLTGTVFPRQEKRIASTLSSFPDGTQRALNLAQRERERERSINFIPKGK